MDEQTYWRKARRTLWRGRWDALIALSIVVAYAPSYLAQYAWGDDYPLLAWAQGLGPSLTPHYVGGGRPLAIGVARASFEAAGSIENLQYLRLAGVLGIASVGIVVFRSLRHAGVAPPVGAPFSVAVCLLPAYHVMAGWATAWTGGFTCALAAGGSWILSSDRSDDARRTWAVGFLLLAILLANQPAAMYLWVPFAARLTIARLPWAVARVEMRRHVQSLAIAVAGAAAVAGTTAIVAGVRPLARSSPVSTAPELVEKLTWFVTRPVILGARPYLIESPSLRGAILTAGPFLVFTAVGLWWNARRADGNRSARKKLMVLTLLLIPLAMAPNLLVAENQIEFRVLHALTTVMLIYAFAAGRSLLEAVRFGHRFRQVAPVGLWVIAVVGALAARTSIHDVFIGPGTANLSYLRSELAVFDPHDTRRIEVVVSSTETNDLPRVGIYSLRTDFGHAWVPVPAVQTVLATRGTRISPAAISVVDDEPSGESDRFVLDARPLFETGGDER